jgi:hypothetical protein
MTTALNGELRIDGNLESVGQRVGLVRRRNHGEQLLILRFCHSLLKAAAVCEWMQYSQLFVMDTAT